MTGGVILQERTKRASPCHPEERTKCAQLCHPEERTECASRRTLVPGACRGGDLLQSGSCCLEERREAMGFGEEGVVAVIGVEFQVMRINVPL